MNDAAHAAHSAEGTAGAQHIADRRSAKGRSRTPPRVYYTRLANTASTVLMVGVPAWYLGARVEWAPKPMPEIDWLWSIAPSIAFVLFAVHIYWTLCAATADSDDLGMGKDWTALLAVLSIFGTGVAMVVLYAVGKYTMGWFQVQGVVTLFVAAICIHQFSSWIRRLVNRRTFAGNAAGVDA